LYDFSRERSHAAALEAELKCLKATVGPSTVAYEVVEVPVQSDDIPPPADDNVVQVSTSRHVDYADTPVDNRVVQGLAATMTQRQPSMPASIVHRPDVAAALTLQPHAADTRTVYSSHGTSQSTLPQSFISSSMPEPTRYRPGPQYTQPPQYFASDSVYMQHQSDIQPRTPVTCATAASGPVHTPRPAHTFPRSLIQPACTQSTVTSPSPCQPIVPGESLFVDNAVQRSHVVDRVDSSNVYKHSIEQLLADLPPPPHIHRQPMLPLSSVYTQTTVNQYVNTGSTTSLPAQRYVNIPAYSNAPPIRPGQGNVTDASALYAHSYTSDLTRSSGLVALDRDIAYTCSSYADNSQPLPIAVGQPGLSVFSHVDVPQSRPIAVDSTVQYAVCTSIPSATADYIRPNVTTPPAPLQSPSLQWKKRLSYDYIPPDTLAGAPIQAAPTTQSVYIRPQTTHTHNQLVCTCQTCHLVQGRHIPSRHPDHTCHTVM